MAYVAALLKRDFTLFVSLLLLLMELENIDTVKRALNSIEGVSQSSDKLAKTAAELPASIKKEAESLLQSLDEKQENIQQTLKQAETTVDIALRVTENVKSITQTLAGTSQEYSDAAIEFRNTADAVTETVQTIRAFLEARDLAGKDKPRSDITIRDYNEAAKNITAAAAELRAGINELNETINNRQAVAQIIEHTSDQSRQLVNHIAKVAALLILLAFSLSVIFLIIKRKLTPKNA
jgi:methyl-accepting chemotaxis protein